jgi:uncharacterized membrane protein (DUF2068 family)
MCGVHRIPPGRFVVGTSTPDPSRSSDRVGTSSSSVTRDRRSDLVIRLIAIERLARGVLLVAVGAVLSADTRIDWATRLRDWADDLGLDPSRHVVVARLIDRAAALTPHQLLAIGLVALAYGGLEIVEGVGLWMRRRWAEYLTVIATALFIPLEIWELAHRPSVLKAGGLVINVLVVAYLIVMLRRRARRDQMDGES